MNGFERHGIRHLSASTINLFAAQPALFVMEKLLNRRGPVGCAAHRGTAAEAGITRGLLNPGASVEECQKIAQSEYARLSALSGDPGRQKEGDAVPGIVATALKELRQYGVPDQVQVKIERELPGVPVPFIGYLDFGWSSHALTLDLKTQLRLSSEIKTGHARQLALYLHGTNNEGRIAYTTPAKIGVYRLDDRAQHLAAVVNIAQRMERFLSLSDDPLVLAGVVVPDYESFFWNEPIARAAGREVFGF